MSEDDKTMCLEPGRVGWNELITTDTADAAAFYGKLFGWKSVPFTPKGMPAGGAPYTIFKKDPNDEMGLAGMLPAPQPGMPSQWLPYVIVENVDTALKQAEGLGARVLLPVTSIGEIGRIAVLQDPQGATIGLHESPKT